MKLSEKIEYLKKWAQAQPDIVLCSHIFAVCDAAMNDVPATTTYNPESKERLIPVNPSPDKLFIKREYLFLPWDGFGVGERGESCYFLGTRQRQCVIETLSLPAPMQNLATER